METEATMRTDGAASARAWREVETQGRLAPGTRGWWQVWGAGVRDVRAGDLVLGKREDGDQQAMLIDELYDSPLAPMRQGFMADGERFTLGALCPIVLLRRGTHHTLAGSLR